MRKITFLLLFLLLSLKALLAQNEPPDFPAFFPGPVPNFSLTSGANVFSGTLETPFDGQDAWSTTLAAGQTITSIVATASGGSFTGSYQYGGLGAVNNGNGTLNASNADFTAPGTYNHIFSTGFSTGTNWTITINVMGPSTCTNPTLPSVVSSPSIICSGGTATLNITGTLNDATSWVIYSGSCGGTLIGSTNGSTFNVSPPNGTTTYFIRGEGGCVTPGTCTSLMVNTTAAEDASFSYAAATYCPNESDPMPMVTGVMGGTFTSTVGLIINTTTGVVDLSASTQGTYTITYTTNGTCPNASNESITVEDIIAPVVVCQDITVQLDASGMASIVADDLSPTQDYSLNQTGIFAPTDISGTGTAVSLTDDVLSGALPIGFGFNFYGNDYTNFYISSNGFVTFDAASGNGCCQGQALPNISTPNNLIAFAWEDLNPSTGGVISYETIGIPGSQVLIVDFNNVPAYGGGYSATVQLKVFESSNKIEIHTTSLVVGPFDNTTQGLENIDGTEATTVPGRNRQIVSVTNDYLEFTPNSITSDNCGIASTMIDVSTFDCSDIGANTVALTVTDVNGNTATCTSTVTVEDSIAPVAVCMPFTAQLDASGSVTITGADVDGGSTDNCAVTSNSPSLINP